MIKKGKIKMNDVKANITMDDLDKIDVRVGTIASVEDMPNSNKLVKLIVDFGEDEGRTG